MIPQPTSPHARRCSARRRWKSYRVWAVPWQARRTRTNGPCSISRAPAQAALQVYGASFVVLKSTPQQQLAAWLFLRWMLASQQQEKWVEVTGLFPLRTSMQPSLDAYARSHPQWAAAVKLLPDGQGQPQLASWRQVRIMIGDGFDAMFRTNTPSGRVAEILAIMDRTARDLSP